MAKYIDKHLDEVAEDIWHRLGMGWGDCFNGLQVLKAFAYCCNTADNLYKPTSGFVLSGAVEILTILDELDVDRESWLA